MVPNDTTWKEEYIKRGDPTKPTYYIIRREMQTGLFALYKVFAGHIVYALSKGWLPVVDMQNYPNVYLAPEKLGKENSWEYYFEQPLRIGLEEAYNGENVVLGNGSGLTVPILYETMALLENQNNVLTEWRMLRKFGLLKVKPKFYEESLMARKTLFEPNDRVLGVHLRGTDYLSERPHGHPIPPPLEFAISTILEKLDEWDCNKIFLATEDKNIVQNFKNIFGDTCVLLNKAYLNYESGKWVTEQRINRDNDYFLQGKEYLIESLILSQCNSYISSRCSGAVGVMMLADNFEHTYFFNLGRYGMITLD